MGELQCPGPVLEVEYGTFPKLALPTQRVSPN